MRRILYVLFVATAIVFLIAHYANSQLICDITKPLPILLLLLLIKWNTRYRLLIGLGFAFSMAGDIVLESFKLFVPGLITFLFAHIFYLFAFINKSSKAALISCVPFYMYGMLFFLFLHPFLGEMAIPVLAYMLIITTMLWRSYVQRNADKLAIFAFVGALLFTISDSLIAVSKFYLDFNYGSLLIMITYWLAQFLIYWSTLEKRELENKKIQE